MNKDLVVGNLKLVPLLANQAVSAGTTYGTGVDLTPYTGKAIVLADASTGTKSSDMASYGTMADTAAWSKGPGWSVANNKATSDGSQTANSVLGCYYSGVTSSQTYVAKYTLADRTAGEIVATLAALGNFSANGTILDKFTAPSAQPRVKITADADFVGSVSNYSAYAIAGSTIDNPDFAATGNWVLGTGWTIGGGVASCDGTQTDVSALEQTTASFGLNKNSTRFVLVTFTITACSAGSIKPLALGFTGTARTAPGTYTEIIDCGTPPAAGSSLGLQADADFVGSVDNVSWEWYSSTAAAGGDSTFAVTGYWHLGYGWNIASGVATRTNTGAASDLALPLTVTAGQTYEVVYTLTRTSGSITPMLGGTSGTTKSSAGTYTENIVCGSGANPVLVFRASSDFAGTLDNVTVKTLSAQITLQESSDNSAYTDVPGGDFTATSFVTASCQKKTINVDERKQYIRAKAVISGTAASATMNCHMLALTE